MFVARRMQKNPVTMSPSTSLYEAQEKMRMRAIHQIPVVDGDGKIVGILSDRDIRATVLPVGMIPGFTAEEAEKFLKNTPVEKFMKRKVIVAPLPTPRGRDRPPYNFKINACRWWTRTTRSRHHLAYKRPGSVHRGQRHGRGQLPPRRGVADKALLMAQVFSVHQLLPREHHEILTTALGPGKRTCFPIRHLNVGPNRKALEEAGSRSSTRPTFPGGEGGRPLRPPNTSLLPQYPPPPGSRSAPRRRSPGTSHPVPARTVREFVSRFLSVAYLVS